MGSNCFAGRKCWEDESPQSSGLAPSKGKKDPEIDFFDEKELREADNGCPEMDAMAYPLVISGPSGVGKSTLIKELVRRYPETFGSVVSHVARQPKDGETQGVDYHFTTREKMEKEIAAGAFLEYAEVHGCLHGTTKHSVTALAAQGKNCILEYDVAGVKKLKEARFRPRPRLVFFMPPSVPDPIENLEKRIRGRAGDIASNEEIKEILADAVDQIAYAKDSRVHFDAVIVNHDVDQAVSELLGYLGDWSVSPMFFQAVGVKKENFSKDKEDPK